MPTEMTRLDTHSLVLLLLSFALATLAARLFGEIAKSQGQPSVLGEILAGVLLGATVLGRIAPSAYQAVFPRTGPSAVVFNTTTQIGVLLFILIAALEIDLGSVWSNRKRSLSVALAGLVLPFACGFALAYFAGPLLGLGGTSGRLRVSLFLATALSISALPVIIRTLLDLGLLRTPIGTVVVSAAILDDFIGWLLFGVVASLFGAASGHDPARSAVYVVVLALAMLTVGRVALDRALRYFSKRADGGAGVILGVVMGVGFIGAAIADMIGVHAIFGAFLVGVALGQSRHMPAGVKRALEQFGTFLFAPLFFASVALHVDFVRSFDPILTAVVFAIACIGKVAGCAFGARLTGADLKTSLSIGFAMNARGAMEIVLGRVALEMKLIDERMFTALVIVALGTSALAGPVMRLLLGLARERHKAPNLDHAVEAEQT